MGNLGESRIDLGGGDLAHVYLGLWTNNAITLNLDVYQSQSRARVCLTPKQARSIAKELNAWAPTFEAYERDFSPMPAGASEELS